MPQNQMPSAGQGSVAPIAFVHDFFPPGDGPIGGSGRVLQILALECLNRGLKPVVVVDRFAKSAPPLRRWTRDGLPVYQFPLLRSIPASSHPVGITRRRQWLARWALPRLLREIQPRIVHIHVDFPNGLLRLGLEMKRRLGTKVVVTSHGLEGFEQMGERYERAGLEPDWLAAVEAVDVWVPCGPADRVELVRWGIPETKIRTINNGVPVPGELAPREFPDSLGTVTIAYVGNITGTKGVFDLAAAMAHFVELAPTIQPRLQFVGNASADVVRILKETLDPLGNRIEWQLLGHQPPERVVEIYHQADIFCYPTRRREGIPMAILEAAAHGCPLVVSDAPGPAAVLTPEVHAVVHKARDRQALAAALARTARDGSLRRRIREAAYRHVREHYNRERMVNEYLALFEELLGSRSP